jgi:REP element-mobilizing transposase RayT
LQVSYARRATLEPFGPIMGRGVTVSSSQSRFPLAYLITFRCYGTWLHGDERGSTDRFRNAYGSPHIPRSPSWLSIKARTLKHPPVTLDAPRRRAVEAAIREICEMRAWELVAVNVRTNHAHTVVSAQRDPEHVLVALKATATRHMRDAGCWPYDRSPWAAGGSRRYLWTACSVERAVAYVVDGQGGPLPDL